MDTHKLLTNLEHMLKDKSSSERRLILRDVYQQLVPGKRSNQQKPGEYKDAASAGNENLLELVLYLGQKLEEQGLRTYARRLNEYYPTQPTPKD